MTPEPLLPPEGPAELIANVAQSLTVLLHTHRDAAVVCAPHRWVARWLTQLQQAIDLLREQP